MDFKLLASLALFVLTIAFGFWLSHSGKPLNQVILSFHKLIALGAVVLAVLFVLQWLPNSGAHTITQLLLIVLAVMVVTLFITGALLSLGKLLPGIVLTLHKLATGFAVVSAAALIWGLK